MSAVNIVIVAVLTGILYVLVDRIISTLIDLNRTKKNAEKLVPGYKRVVGVKNLLKLWWLQVRLEVESRLGGKHWTFDLSKKWFSDIKDVKTVHNVMSEKCKIPKAIFCPKTKLDEKHPVVDDHVWWNVFHVEFMDETNALVFVPWVSNSESRFHPAMILYDHDINENKIVDTFVAQAGKLRR